MQKLLLRDVKVAIVRCEKSSSMLPWESMLQESPLIEGAAAAATRSIWSSFLIVGRDCKRSTITIGRDCITGIAAPNRVAIYNGDPTRSLKIACFKWNEIGEDAKDRSIVLSYILGHDFDNHYSNILTSFIIISSRSSIRHKYRKWWMLL